MKILGITGTSGSGKTALSEILSEKYNVKIIDADKVAKELSVPGTAYLKEIEKVLGKDIILEDGSLNRRALAEKIYEDKLALENLNKITFEYVVKEILNRIEIQKKNAAVEIVVLDAPLLFESELDKVCDYVIALVADEKVKIKRICKRDHIDEQTAKNRLDIQQKDEFYKSKADMVIINNERNLEDVAKEIFEKIE